MQSRSSHIEPQPLIWPPTFCSRKGAGAGGAYLGYTFSAAYGCAGVGTGWLTIDVDPVPRVTTSVYAYIRPRDRVTGLLGAVTKTGGAPFFTRCRFGGRALPARWVAQAGRSARLFTSRRSLRHRNKRFGDHDIKFWMVSGWTTPETAGACGGIFQTCDVSSAACT